MVSTTDSVVRTVGLTKIFRDFWLREKVVAVADLDLDVRPREVFGLLGPNGSGKSTTLKMILALLFPTRGTISIFSRHPTNVAVKARIGFLPEESNLYPFLDARETLDFYGRLFHLPRAQRLRRIDMLLDMVGLKSVAYRRIGEYSKGMQRRIGLAQALINDPDLLILDEPTSGLDPLGTSQFKDLIRTLAERGKTVILSSHLLADVEDVCDRVSILYGGRERAVGKLDDLLGRADRTQITTEQLDEATLEGIRKLLAGAGKDIMEVARPRDKLESLFLRIVEQARHQRLATGGAISGGRVAEFLASHREPAGREIIESLLEGEKPEPIEEVSAKPVASAPARQVDGQVLDKLLHEEDTNQPAPESHPPAGPKSSDRPEPEADRDVIEGLLGGKSDGGEDD